MIIRGVDFTKEETDKILDALQVTYVDRVDWLEESDIRDWVTKDEEELEQENNGKVISIDYGKVKTCKSFDWGEQWIFFKLDNGSYVYKMIDCDYDHEDMYIVENSLDELLKVWDEWFRDCCYL